MAKKQSLLRKGHFLGTKIRNLRKSNNLTMEDLSVRCVQIDHENAPSVSYLSMIENGKRIPSEPMLEVIAEVFQKEVAWFLDGSDEKSAIIDTSQQKGGIEGVALEPEFLFSKPHLQSALPEMLSQTGTSGRQFAHLLIRAHQEYHHNQFPDLEKAAEQIGKKQMPMHASQMIDVIKKMGMKIKWFKRPPDQVTDETNKSTNTLIRSFFEPPGIVYINEGLKPFPERLNYDLATHIGHYALYGKDGLSSTNAAGYGLIGRSRVESNEMHESMTIDSSDILQAWRDFECSFFASALLCPRAPFKQHLNKTAYAINANRPVGVSMSAYMRRMTSVSPYAHWHYFDAYGPDRLKAVYRGNGIPLPIGNMRSIQDPCPHWSLFRALASDTKIPQAQISILRKGDTDILYACDSICTNDLAGNPHVLCVGVDLNPALASQGIDPKEITSEIKAQCLACDGRAPIPQNIKKELIKVSNILNISWIARGLENDAIVICPRASLCPRDNKCGGEKKNPEPAVSMKDIRQQIIDSIH